MIKQFILFLVVLTGSSYAQSVYKEVAKINDSTDYYLEIGLFNKEEKKSVSKALFFYRKSHCFCQKEGAKIKIRRWLLAIGYRLL